ncbi:MAG: MmgE/PrpD family protein [Hyphomicrobiales bacterium]|nr:MmgE/PrpD family protein [Hyphomicrobiales bacterium]
MNLQKGTLPPDAEPQTVTGRIADHVAGFNLADVPGPAIENARTALLDSVGIMIAGSTDHAFRIVRDMVRLEAASPQSSVVGEAVLTSPQLAAFANGVALHAMDYDMTYFIGQPMSPMIPAILAFAEIHNSTQAEILSAYIVGFEVCSRMARSNWTQGSSGGWHSVSTIGPIAAAAALGYLLKSPRKAIQHAIAITVATASGIGVNYGTMTKPLHCGHGSRNAVVATLLALAGFTASPKALEAKSGYYDVLARDLDWTLEPFDDLGRTHDLLDRGIWIKRYPCGGLLHTGIDAALAMREQLGPRVEEISKAHVGVTKYTAKRAWLAYPDSVESAKFNMNYLVAHALVHGVPGLNAFTEAAIADGRVRAMAARISVGVDAEFADLVEECPARITATLDDGSQCETVQRFPFGSYKLPMSRAQIEEKFFECATLAIAKSNARKLLDMLSTLGEQRSFDQFWPILRNDR